MSDDGLYEALDEGLIEHGPTHPSIASRLLAWARDPDSAPFSQMEELLLCDPAATGYVLRLANSAALGKPGRIGSVAHAAALFDRHLLRVASLQFQVCASDEQRNLFEEFWRTSWLRSRAAGVLASLFHNVTPDEARVAGLLAGWGSLDAPSASEPEVRDATVRRMTAAHFPKSLIEAIEAQGEPDRWHFLSGRSREMATVLSLADQWSRRPKQHSFTTPLGSFDFKFLEPELRKATGRIDEVFAPCEISPEELRRQAQKSLVRISIEHAHALVAKSRLADESLQQAREYMHERDRLREQVTLDPFLGIANRRHFDMRLAEEFKRCQRNGQPLSLILFDIDRFKQINDTYFHQAGDEVLMAVTRAMQNCLRTTDVFARYGGEEFGVVCPETDLIGGLSLAERMRLAIESLDVRHRQLLLRVTASFGLATIDDPGEVTSVRDLLEAADCYLYEAKHSGRNCVRHGACPHPRVPAVVGPRTKRA